MSRTKASPTRRDPASFETEILKLNKIARATGTRLHINVDPDDASDPLLTKVAGHLDAESGCGLAPFNGRGLSTPRARTALTLGNDQACSLETRLDLALLATDMGTI